MRQSKQDGFVRSTGFPGAAAFAAAAVLMMSAAVPAALAQERAAVTVLVASNEGADFDLVNDAYRDQLINLFSYTSYKQTDQQAVELKRGERAEIALPEGYELVLTYQGAENGRHLVNALIRRERQQFVNTILSIVKPGVVFLGGPPVKEGVLILVVEMGF
jgi:hypothetical protein